MTKDLNNNTKKKNNSTEKNNIIESKNNKVFYGEYSLKHWIDLIIKRQIILPPYQRYFVWSEEQASQLINNIKNIAFVPPITIGSYMKNGKLDNIIIDGQQRLTCILLAALGLFPDITKFKEKSIKYANTNDDFTDSNDEEEIIEWRFDILLDDNTTTLDQLKEKIKTTDQSNYKDFSETFSNEELEKYFIGFCYLVPDPNNEDYYQQKYYSTVFRNLNVQGLPLTVQESREALYYLNESYKEFFHPAFVDKYSVNNGKVDFVRLLSALFQYKKNNGKTVAYRFTYKMEQFYESFIYHIVYDDDNNNRKNKDVSRRFCSIDEVVGSTEKKDRSQCINERMNNVIININKLSLPMEYSSIIDFDVYFFGLIYFTFIEGKNIDEKRKAELKNKILTQINIFRQDHNHLKSPNSNSFFNQRIKESIQIYKEYIKNE